MWSNFHTNTCDKIPELGQKCWLDRPDSLPAVRSHKGVESGNETINHQVKDKCKKETLLQI